jgi:hypothetical protein
MNSLLICVVAATMGWRYGYERLPDGGMEYIIQLDAASVESLRDGQPIKSNIPSDIGEVRSFRVVMGTGWPRRDPPPAKLPPAKTVEMPPLTPPKAAEKPDAAPTPDVKPAEPRMPWVLLLLALFASIGGNLFLGWIAWGLRRRCQTTS